MSSRPGGGRAPPQQAPPVINLEGYLEKRIRVRFAGGREVVGLLKGFDGLVNIVLDDAVEYLRDPSDAGTLTEQTRYLGLVVARGTAVTIVGAEDGFRAIANPFADEEAADGEMADAAGAAATT